MAIPIIPAVATGVGLLGSLFGGNEDQTTTVQNRRLSLEQQALFDMLQKRLNRQGLDTSGIASATRERIGNESSALRQGALQRLQRGGVGALQTESALGGITREGLRQTGSVLADLDFQAQTFDEDQRNKTLQMMQMLLQGTGEVTSRASTDGGFGQGFNTLFGAGLRGILGTQEV